MSTSHLAASRKSFLCRSLFEIEAEIRKICMRITVLFLTFCEFGFEDAIRRSRFFSRMLPRFDSCPSIKETKWSQMLTILFSLTRLYNNGSHNFFLLSTTFAQAYLVLYIYIPCVKLSSLYLWSYIPCVLP